MELYDNIPFMWNYSKYNISYIVPESRPRLLSRIKEWRRMVWEQEISKRHKETEGWWESPYFYYGDDFTDQTYPNVHYKYVVYCMPIIL